MPASVLTLIVALILVVIAWKVFSGVVKTLALLAILVVAAVFVFGGFA
ncbi:hypothetical protein MKP08_11275 [Erythrobacter sp. LQ02-29]|nr:hypothetical protein [Erythrobacter sp. LQ02-29]MCP9223332.1 hypothetical protein [Erythrobacter sp. LQ02-29]